MAENGFLAMFQKEGKPNYAAILLFVLLLAICGWAFSKLFGKTNYTVTNGREKLEIVTTNNAIPNTPVSKVPLKALGVLAQNNHRRYLPGFDVEGDGPS